MKLYIPTLVYSESGCVKAHRKELAGLGTKAMIVTGGHSSKRNGSLADVVDALTKEKIPHVIFDEIEENPSVETVARAAKMAQLAKILSPYAVELKTADGKLPFFGIYNSKDEDNVIFIPIVNTSGSDELAEGTPIPIPSNVSWPASKPLTLTTPQALVKAEMLNYPDNTSTKLDVAKNVVQIPMPEKFGILKITF